MASGATTPPLSSGASTPPLSATNTPASSAPSVSGHPAATDAEAEAAVQQAEAEEDENEMAAREAAAWPDASIEFQADDPSDNTKKIMKKNYFYKMSAEAQQRAKASDEIPNYYTYICQDLSPQFFENLFLVDPVDNTKKTRLTDQQKKVGFMLNEDETRRLIGLQPKPGSKNSPWSFRGDAMGKQGNITARDPLTGALCKLEFSPHKDLKSELRGRYAFQITAAAATASGDAQMFDRTSITRTTSQASWKVNNAPTGVANDLNYRFDQYQNLTSYVWYELKNCGENNAPVGDDELYIRLLSKHVKKFWGAAARVYLHKGYFEKLTTSLASNGKVPESIKSRNEIGEAKVLRIDDDYGRGIAEWNVYYAESISQADVDRGGKFPRAIDPAGLTIYINQIDDDKTIFGEPLKGKPQQTLKGIFEAIKKEKKNIVVDYEFVTGDHDKLVKDGYHLLSISPFGNYKTYVLATQFATYLECNKNRPMFTDIKDVRKCGQKIKPPVPIKSGDGSGGAAKKQKPDCEYTRTQVDADSIEKARKTERKTLPDQGVVMGESATYVASKVYLNWEEMRKKPVTTRHLPTNRKNSDGSAVTAPIVWPKQNYHPSEWLHRSAYSYGGTTYKTPVTSQSGTNLVFGSSETNSVMTRYEEIIKFCVVREKTLEAELWALYQKYNEEHADKKLKFPPPTLGPWKKTDAQPQKSVFGNVVTHFGKAAPSYEVTTTNGIAAFKAIEVPMIADSENNVADKDIKDWAALSNQYPWHCTDLEYNFTLERHGHTTKSLIMPGFLGTNHHFYPFMRPFFTRLEGAVDDRMLTVLCKAQAEKYKATLEEVLTGSLNTDLSKMALSSSGGSK